MIDAAVKAFLIKQRAHHERAIGAIDALLESSDAGGKRDTPTTDDAIELKIAEFRAVCARDGHSVSGDDKVIEIVATALLGYRSKSSLRRWRNGEVDGPDLGATLRGNRYVYSLAILAAYAVEPEKFPGRTRSVALNRAQSRLVRSCETS